jgi:uncharacterized protein
MNLDSIEAFVTERLVGDSTGHDVHHCFHVRRLGTKLSILEGSGDLIVISCAALLHDVPDREQAKQDIVAVMQSA